mmetsp:Transcript_17185/g.41182  ORF Transcript_17185/g.41182 Transcript_17185/m.41182 type:complete len:323 (+) Transcript_17185:199-1167(+)
MYWRRDVLYPWYFCCTTSCTSMFLPLFCFSSFRGMRISRGLESMSSSGPPFGLSQRLEMMMSVPCCTKRGNKLRSASSVLYCDHSVMISRDCALPFPSSSGSFFSLQLTIGTITSSAPVPFRNEKDSKPMDFSPLLFFVTTRASAPSRTLEVLKPLPYCPILSPLFLPSDIPNDIIRCKWWRSIPPPLSSTVSIGFPSLSFSTFKCTCVHPLGISSTELSRSSAIAPKVHSCEVALEWRNLGCTRAVCSPSIRPAFTAALYSPACQNVLAVFPSSAAGCACAGTEKSAIFCGGSGCNKVSTQHLASVLQFLLRSGYDVKALI